jgi:hypothetical protein
VIYPKSSYGFARYQAGAGVGGYIVKDKTFYYLNFEHTTDVKDNLLMCFGINETVEEQIHLIIFLLVIKFESKF